MSQETQNQDVDGLLAGLGAAVQDFDQGTKYTALFSMEGTIDAQLSDDETAKALWGLDLEQLKQKGQDLWDRVSPKLYE